MNNSGDKYLQLFANNIPDIIAIFDRDFKHIYINTQVEIETGLQPESFIGKTHRDLKWTENLIELWENNLEEVFETGSPKSFEFQYELPKGISFYQSKLIPELNSDNVVESVLAISRNITDQKNAELKIQKLKTELEQRVSSNSNRLMRSEIHYQSLFNKMTEGFALFEIICAKNNKPADFRYLEINPAFEKHTGLKSKDVIGKMISEVLPKDDPKWFDTSGEAVLSGKSFQFEYISPTLKKHFEVYAYSPKPLQVAALFIDITKKKHTEKSLYESQERLKYHIENSPLAIVEWDANYLVVFWSKEAEHLFGWSATETVGKRIDALNMIYEPDIPIVNKTMERLNSGKELTVVSSNRNITKDGSVIECIWYNSVLTNEKGEMTSIMSLIQDITETKRAEDALRESEQRFRLALKNAPVSVAVQDLDLRFTFAYNQRTIQPSEICGKTDNDLFSPEDAARLIELKRKVIETGEEIRESLWITSNGKRVFLELFLEPIKNESGKITGIGIATIDLTPLKLVEKRIKHLASFPKLNPNPVIETDINGRITYCNYAAVKILKNLNAGKDISKFFPEDFNEIIKSINETDAIKTLNREVNIKGRIFSENINFSKEANFVRIQANDITEQKNTEDQLRKLWRAVEQSPDSIVITDNTGKIEYVNPKFTEITGYSFNEALGKKPSILKSGETKPEIYQTLWKNITSGKEFRSILYNKKKSGELYWESVNISPVRSPEGEITNFVAVKEDITERKKAEEKLNRLNRTLNALRHSTETILRATDKQTYMHEVCKIIVEDCGHKMIWIGFAEENENKTVLPVASAGFDEGYLSKLNITWSDSERGRGPTGIAIRTGIPTICNNMLIDPLFRPWRADAIKRGYASSVVLPLKDNKKVFGAMSIYSGEPDSFSQDEVNLLSELANNLAYGISVIRLRNAKELAEEELKKHRDHLEVLVQQRTSELEITNEILKDAQAVAHIGHWYFDLVNKNLIWSDEVYRILGTEPKNLEPSREAFLIFVHPDDCEFVESKLKNSLDNRKPFNIDYRLIRPDGEIRDVHEQITIYYNQTDEPSYILGAIQDITEFKKTEKELAIHKNNLEDLVRRRTEELAVANQMLKDEIEKERQVELLLQNSLEKEKELNELKSRFISTTSHEFRTPLTSVLSSMQLIQRYRKKWSDEKLEDQFARIKNSIFNLTGLLDDILTISHADSGKIVFSPQKIDFYQFCLELIEEVKHKANKNHKFNFNYSSKKKEFSLDPKLIRFILVNLLSNAFKYSPKGGKVILNVSSKNKYINISVTDEGIGIPQDDKKHLFKPFFRSRNTRDIEGTGLGLSIVQRALEMHHGEIKCYSKLGKGTKFSLKIPEEL